MSTVTDLETYQQFALQQQAQNNAWSAEQAQKQMDFQREMSNTAHQREVADLKAAGLNPVLSANSGASVPNGAAGDTDTSAAGNVGAILQQVLQAQSAREVAAMYNAATINAASIAANASMYGADVAAETQREYPNSVGGIAGRLVRQLQEGLGSSNPSSAAKAAVSAFSGNVFSSLFKTSWFNNMTSKQKSAVLAAYKKQPKLFDSLFRLGRGDLIGKLLTSFMRARFSGSSGKF